MSPPDRVAEPELEHSDEKYDAAYDEALLAELDEIVQQERRIAESDSAPQGPAVGGCASPSFEDLLPYGTWLARVLGRDWGA